MNDISPLVLLFAFFFISIALVIVGVAVWSVGQVRRSRMASAVRQLNEIVSLANEALRTGSAEKQQAANNRIEEWDRSYGREVGAEISKLGAV